MLADSNRHHQMIGDPHRVEPQRLGVLGEADEILAARPEARSWEE